MATARWLVDLALNDNAASSSDPNGMASSPRTDDGEGIAQVCHTNITSFFCVRCALVTESCLPYICDIIIDHSDGDSVASVPQGHLPRR